MSASLLYCIHMHPLLIKQNELHAEATHLITEVLSPVLREFGEFIVGGSYVYTLLNHPDIDIDVVSPHASREVYAELCKKLLLLPQVSVLKTKDRVAFPHAHRGDRPTGYWIAPRIVYDEHTWTVDIWLQKPESHTGQTCRFAERLAQIGDEERVTILSLKEQLIAEGCYGVGQEFESVHVYDAVLDKGIRSAEELRSSMSKKCFLD